MNVSLEEFIFVGVVWKFLCKEIDASRGKYKFWVMISKVLVIILKVWVL